MRSTLVAKKGRALTMVIAVIARIKVIRVITGLEIGTIRLKYVP